MHNQYSPVSYAMPTPQGIGALPSPLNVGAGSLPFVYWAQPVGGTTQGALGGAVTATGTVSTALTPASTAYARLRRTRITGAAGAGSSGSAYVGYTRWYRGTNGGFEAQIVFGLAANTTGFSSFVGFSTLTTGLTAADITTLTDCVGIGFSSTDANTSVWKLVYNDAAGAATTTDIPGMTRNATSGYVLRISCPKGDTANITISISDVMSGAVILTPTTLTSNLPTAATTMSVGCHSYNGAIASAAIIDYSSIYVTCDY